MNVVYCRAKPKDGICYFTSKQILHFGFVKQFAKLSTSYALLNVEVITSNTNIMCSLLCLLQCGLRSTTV